VPSKGIVGSQSLNLSQLLNLCCNHYALPCPFSMMCHPQMRPKVMGLCLTMEWNNQNCELNKTFLFINKLCQLFVALRKLNNTTFLTDNFLNVLFYSDCDPEHDLYK
jgi:hypothetical protein